MKPERENTITVLVDIAYENSLNSFEEFFGENVSYRELEQRSYVEFKDLIFEKINKDIKFRKFGRIGEILTIKVDMLKKEIEKLKRLMKTEKLKMTTDWSVKEITIIKDAKELENYWN